MTRLIALATLTLTLLATGCATHTTTTEGSRIDNYTVSDIKAGVTTREEIISTFGIPTAIELQSGEEVLKYEYTEKTTPAYLGGKVVVEKNAAITRNVLEVRIKNEKVSSYRFKSSSTK